MTPDKPRSRRRLSKDGTLGRDTNPLTPDLGAIIEKARQGIPLTRCEAYDLAKAFLTLADSLQA